MDLRPSEPVLRKGRFRPSLRFRELFLLLPAVGLVWAGIGAVSAARTAQMPTPADLTGGLVLLASTIAVHVALCIQGSRADQFVLPTVVMLSGLGYVEIRRLAESDVASRQVTWLVVGMAVAMVLLLSGRGLGWIQRYKYSVLTFGLILVALTLVFGRDLNGSGARLWLGVGALSYQPSELLKVLLVMFLAAYLDEHSAVIGQGHYRLGPLALPPIPYLVPMLTMWGLAVLLLVVQRDLGAALLLFGIFGSMVYLASGRYLYLLVGLLAFGGAVWVAYSVIPVFQGRVDVWLDPWSRSTGLGYQLIQGLLALASGGVLGTGLGFGSPGLVPAVHTDFAIVAVGEELGLAGTLGVVGLYAILIVRGYGVAIRAASGFVALLAAGLTSVLAVQSLVILFGTLRVMPLTGITLPFISYGGSSILTNYVIVGLLLRIDRDADRPVAAGQ